MIAARVIAAIVVLVLGVALSETAAASGAASDPAPAVEAASTTAPPAVDTWMGVVAAMGCGLGIKNFPAIAGAGVGAIAGVVALCALMLVDAMGTPDAP